MHVLVVDVVILITNSVARYERKVILHGTTIFKPGARPQPAEGWLWARAWFTEIVFLKVVCVCIYLPIYVCPYAPT